MRRPIAARLGSSTARTIHLVDMENLAQSPHVTPSMVQRIRLDYRRCVDIGPLDQFVVAVSHHNVPGIMGQIGSARLVVQSGRDGADRSLLEIMQLESIADRFDSICVASGDGIFAHAVAAIAASGSRVIAVARPGCMSARMRLAAHDSIDLTYCAQNEWSVA